MITSNGRRLNTYWQRMVASLTLIAAVVVGSVALTTAPVSAAATYSCGTYSSGTYSENATCNGTVGTPNTGFAKKLLEPVNLAAIVGSLALLIAGIAIILKSKSRKKPTVSFDSRE